MPLNFSVPAVSMFLMSGYFVFRATGSQDLGIAVTAALVGLGAVANGISHQLAIQLRRPKSG